MSTTVRIHSSTPKVVLATIVLIGILVFLARFQDRTHDGQFLKSAPAEIVAESDSAHRVLGSIPGNSTLVAPVIQLKCLDSQHESTWSAALADVLGGETEVSVEYGRVDVVSALYAVEVDRLNKWHEAIGQALHYASATKKSPVVALIVPDIAAADIDKLYFIQKECSESAILLILLTEVRTEQ
jgi:hypothetical protein